MGVGRRGADARLDTVDEGLLRVWRLVSPEGNSQTDDCHGIPFIRPLKSLHCSHFILPHARDATDFAVTRCFSHFNLQEES